MRRNAPMLFLATAVLLSATGAGARVKLTALPRRERVEIQLDNAKYTLVEEERLIPLLKSTPETGNNMIDFSWSNTQIDKNTIRFRPLAILSGGRLRPVGKVRGRAEVAVINSAYPPNENALVWEVYAAKACTAKVRVSYLLQKLTRTFSYRALTNKDETQLALRNFIVVENFSGEEYGQAGVWAGFGPKFMKPVGQQSRIKVLLHRFPRVAVKKTYTFDWYAHGPLNPAKPLASRVLMHYNLKNDEATGLGLFPLQPGKVRIFIEDGRGGEAFLGEDWGRLTPLDDTMRLYVGQARDIVCRRIIEKSIRHPRQGNLFDQELVFRYEIENFKDRRVTLDMVTQMNRIAREYGRDPHGDAEWEEGELTSDEISITRPRGHMTPVLHVDLAARPPGRDEKVEKKIVRFHFFIKNLW